MASEFDLTSQSILVFKRFFPFFPELPIIFPRQLGMFCVTRNWQINGITPWYQQSLVVPSCGFQLIKEICLIGFICNCQTRFKSPFITFSRRSMDKMLERSSHNWGLHCIVPNDLPNRWISSLNEVYSILLGKNGVLCDKNLLRRKKDDKYWVHMRQDITDQYVQTTDFNHKIAFCGDWHFYVYYWFYSWLMWRFIRIATLSYYLLLSLLWLCIVTLFFCLCTRGKLRKSIPHRPSQLQIKTILRTLIDRSDFGFYEEIWSKIQSNEKKERPNEKRKYTCWQSVLLILLMINVTLHSYCNLFILFTCHIYDFALLHYSSARDQTRKASIPADKLYHWLYSWLMWRSIRFTSYLLLSLLWICIVLLFFR